MPDWSAIRSQLTDAGIAAKSLAHPVPVSGGDISDAWHLATDDGGVFIKTGPLSAASIFSAEADGLKEIAGSGSVRVPAVRLSGQTDATAFIALEWLQLERPTEAVETSLGAELAAMHRSTADSFGWHRDNAIGLTPQHNKRNDDWVSFYREQRLGFQLRLAAENGFGEELQEHGARLLKRLPVYFDNVATPVSLLHGDLWGGNWAACDGLPVVFDPAVYYGDRETDLALTRLFGGFGPAFYDAYESSWPLQDGYLERQHLYQLYHVLNHLNLFGSAYLGQAQRLIKELL